MYQSSVMIVFLHLVHPLLFWLYVDKCATVFIQNEWCALLAKTFMIKHCKPVPKQSNSSIPPVCIQLDLNDSITPLAYSA